MSLILPQLHQLPQRRNEIAFTRKAWFPLGHQSRPQTGTAVSNLHCNSQHGDRLAQPTAFSDLGRAPSVRWLRGLVWATQHLGTGAGMALLISVVLWWVALTVMVSAVALRWQVAHERIALRSGRHAVNARHRR